MTHLRRNTIVERISDGATTVISRKPDNEYWIRFAKAWPSATYIWTEHPVTDNLIGDAWSKAERQLAKDAGKPKLNRRGV